MENYIVINGEKAELTEEQLKALGIEMKAECKSPYDRVKLEEFYFCINCIFEVNPYAERRDSTDEMIFNSKNHYNNRDFAEQKALRMKLTNMLEDFSYKNGWKDEYRYGDIICKHYIKYDCENKKFITNNISSWISLNDVYFISGKVAEQAIEEIVKPFMAENPQFKW